MGTRRNASTRARGTLDDTSTGPIRPNTINFRRPITRLSRGTAPNPRETANGALAPSLLSRSTMRHSTATMGRRVVSTAIGGMIAIALAACTTSASSAPNSAATAPKLSIPEAEAGLAKMFTDDEGKATFSCTDGGTRYAFICYGRYVSNDPSDGVVEHRIGVNVSHYFEGKPVFAIQVLRDGAK